MRMRVINRYSLPTAMLTTQWDSNAVYKMQITIEHKSSKRVKTTRYTKLQLTNDYMLFVISKYCWTIKPCVIILIKMYIHKPQQGKKYEKKIMAYSTRELK